VSSVNLRDAGWNASGSTLTAGDTGGVVSGASPAYNVEEMTYALKTADAKFLATSPTSMAVASDAAKNAGVPRESMFLLEGEMDGYTTVRQLIEIGKSYGKDQTPSYKLPIGKHNKDVCAFLSFRYVVYSLLPYPFQKYTFTPTYHIILTYHPKFWHNWFAESSLDISRQHARPMPASPAHGFALAQKRPRRPTLLPHYRSSLAATHPYPP
jgi:hypothetical protein